MIDYSYSRALADGAYNINNINHTNGTGIPVLLYKEMLAEATLPEDFKILCKDADCTISFNVTLTGAQKTTLDTIVSDHKIDN